MNLLFPLLRLSAALAVLTVWWAPTSAQPTPAEARVSSDAPAPARAATSALASADVCAVEAAPQVDDAPRVERIAARARPCAPRRPPRGSRGRTPPPAGAAAPPATGCCARVRHTPARPDALPPAPSGAGALAPLRTARRRRRARGPFDRARPAATP
ncbi:MAG: hypothetical protein H6704_28350 [Myxococcales bacterium]|nr:hypothetical protein [Myxococcales bacterium]